MLAEGGEDGRREGRRRRWVVRESERAEVKDRVEVKVEAGCYGEWEEDGEKAGKKGSQGHGGWPVGRSNNI